MEQLVYTPQHKLVVLPEDGAGLSPNKLKKLIQKSLKDRENGLFEEAFDYVVLEVTLDKVSNDDIKELEDLVNSKNAVLCKIQKIIPQLEVTTITGGQRLKSIDDILNRDPMETLREAYLIEHGTEMNEQQLALLAELLNGIKNESND